MAAETRLRAADRPGRLYVAAAVAALFAAGLLAILPWRARAPRKTVGISPAPRDVILITIDTLRADAPGYAGNHRITTPFLDSLAARGVVFTNAHAHNVITLPSHVNILTGLYPFQHGVRENAGFRLDPKFPTLAAMLRPLGYATAAFVGAFPLDRRFGLSPGFDVYDDNYGKGQASVDFVLQERRAAAVLDAAARWWKGNDGRKRFLWVHLYDPHAPYAPPEPFLTQYRGDEYHGEVAYADSELGRVLGPILEADRDALVVVTGDHGEALGDHGERTHGLFAYESTLKVPLIVAGGGVAHRVQSAWVRHIDIVPTILAAVGAKPAAQLRGSSLLSDPGPRDSYFESLSASLNRGWAPLTGIIHGGRKYIDLPIAELYDLPRDPGERLNLRDTQRRDVEEARHLLSPMLAAPASARGAVDAETAAKLQSLGYVSGAAEPKKQYTAGDDPKNLIALDAMMHDAIDAFEQNQRARALQLARQLVARRPGMTAANEILAFMLQANDLVDDAIHELEAIVRDQNGSDADRVQLALLYSETGAPQKAIALLAPRAAGNDPDVLNAYGIALLDGGRYDEALAAFQRVLSIDPENAPALQNLGIAALKHDDQARSESYLRRALDLNPRLPLALNTIGVLYARRSDFPAAVEAWNRAVEIDPQQYDALYNIAHVAGHLGDRKEARRALTRFVETAPRSRYAADIDAARKTLAAQ